MRRFLIIFFAEYGVVVLGVLAALFILLADGLDTKLYIALVTSLSTLTAVVFAKMLKRFFKQNRPDSQKELFVPFDRYAFPSGHASGITALALSFSVFSVWYGALLGGIGIAVVIARIMAGVHFARDIVGGFLFSAVGIYFLLPFIYKMSEYFLSFYFST